MHVRRLPVAFALVLVLAVPLFAGCLGGKKGNADAKTDDAFVFVPPPEVEVPSEPVDNKTNLYTPKAHFHHYWGEGDGVPMVVIFDSNPRGGMEFEQFPLDEHKDNYNAPIGFVEFNLETDGDDVTAGDGADATNALNGKADAVFAGTSHLVVNISWDTDGDRALAHTGDLRFRFQPACLPIYQPADNAGIPIVENPAGSDGVVRANPIRIPVSPRCADPPHQIAVSRWAFVITSYPNDGTSTLNSVFPKSSLAKGYINVKIEAQNGGESAIGPPHPDLYNGSAELQLGPPVEGTFKLKLGGEQPEVKLPTGEVVAQRQCSRLGDSFGDSDIQLPKRHIVPFQTKEIVITVTLAYDAAANNDIPDAYAAKVRLLYHPANHTRYEVAPNFEGSETEQTYKIVLRFDPANGISDLAMTDPVYNVDSDWRFGFTLFTNDQPCLGTWAGSYAISVKAIRNPEITIF